jgi:hypothetical protein
MSPFDILKIIIKKEDIEWVEISSHYNPWIINLALSFDIHTVLLANELNKNYSVPYKWQYDFLRNAVPKNTKYKWIKGSKDNNESDLKILESYYNVSRTKAEEILKLLSAEQLKIIKTRALK